jgi:hypothetical protein
MAAPLGSAHGSPPNWDILVDAVCVRLTDLACRATAREVQIGVLDCVAALARLNVELAYERARHTEQKLQARSALADPKRAPMTGSLGAAKSR